MQFFIFPVITFLRIVIGTLFLRTALRDGFGAFHHEGAAQIADRASGFGFDGVFAFGVAGTAVEDAEAAVTAHHLARYVSLREISRSETYRADHAGFLTAGAALVFFNVFAFRVSVARDKLSEFSIALDELAVFTLGTVLTGLFGSFAFGAVERAHASAIGEARTAQKFSGSAEFDHHIGVADWTLNSFGRITECSELGRVFFGCDVFGEWGIKIAQGLFIFPLTFSNVVEFVLHLRGE